MKLRFISLTLGLLLLGTQIIAQSNADEKFISELVEVQSSRWEDLVGELVDDTEGKKIYRSKKSITGCLAVIQQSREGGFMEFLAVMGEDKKPLPDLDWVIKKLSSTVPAGTEIKDSRTDSELKERLKESTIVKRVINFHVTSSRWVSFELFTDDTYWVWVKELVIGDAVNTKKTYKTVPINNQQWMSENLDVKAFRNGDPIPEVRSAEEWKKAGEEGKPAWCYYNNDGIKNSYGKLYNWHAVNDNRGLAPAGWHIPSDAEWEILINYLGGEKESALKLATVGGWNSAKAGTNTTRFSAFPAGFRIRLGTFHDAGTSTYWWSSTGTSESASLINIFFSNQYKTLSMLRGPGDKSAGLSVRCIRD